MSRKILFLTRLFYPHIGGVEKHVLELSKRLITQGDQITVLTEQYSPGVFLKENYENIRIVRIPLEKINSKIKLWSFILQNRQLFFDADIVHVHDVGWWIFPLIPFIQKKFHITFHGWEGKYPPEPKAISQRRALAKLARSVMQIGDFIEQWYGTKPDVVTYGATDSFDSKISGSNLKIVFLGRLAPENCIEQVLQTFQLLKQENSNFEFTFVGDGEFRKQCEELGKVTGFVKNPVKYLSEAKVVFAGSYLSIIEAQAHSKFVCALYDHGLKMDYLQTHPNAQHMLIEKDPQVMAKKVLDFVDNSSEMNDHTRQAQRWASQQTWEKLAKQYQQLWDGKK